MKLRKLVLVLFAVLLIAGATLSAVLAAPRMTQEASPGDAPGPDVAAQHRPDKPAHAYLGLLSQKLRDRDRQVLGVPDEVEGGLLVIGTLPGSPAQEAGLQRADVVLSVNGLTLTTPRELDRLVKSMSPGDEIEVVYWRDGERHALGIFLGDRNDHRTLPVPAWLNQLHKFMRMFPNAVDATLHVLDNEGAVHEYALTYGNVLSVSEGGIVIEGRAGGELDFELVDTSVVIKGNHRIELADLVEGTPVVVLEIDGTVKAVVVSRHRAETGQVRPDEIDEIRPNPRKAIVSEFRAYMKELREVFQQGRDRDDIAETIEKLRERIAELQQRLSEANDQDDDSDNSGEGAAA